LRSAAIRRCWPPLLEPRFHTGPPLEEVGELDDVQAILATSANGNRPSRTRTARRDIPVTRWVRRRRRRARSSGFSNVRNADGDAKTLAEATMGWASVRAFFCMSVRKMRRAVWPRCWGGRIYRAPLCALRH